METVPPAAQSDHKSLTTNPQSNLGAYVSCPPILQDVERYKTKRFGFLSLGLPVLRLEERILCL